MSDAVRIDADMVGDTEGGSATASACTAYGPRMLLCIVGLC
jgi:hypothetical protein